MHPSLITLHSARDDPSGGRCPAQIAQLDTPRASKESHNSIHNRAREEEETYSLLLAEYTSWAMEFTTDVVGCVAMQANQPVSSNRLYIVRCYFFDPSVASIGAVGGRRWVGVDRVTCVGGGAGDSANSYTLLACTNDSKLSI